MKTWIVTLLLAVSLLLLAGKPLSFNLYFEYDTVQWSGPTPAVLEEVRRARYVVNVRDWQDFLSDKTLGQLGFAPTKETQDHRWYSLWRQTAKPP